MTDLSPAGSLPERLRPSPAPLAAPDPDAQLLALWLHGRSRHTQRAYAASVVRFRAVVASPLAAVTLADLQCFASTLEPLAPPPSTAPCRR